MDFPSKKHFPSGFPQFEPPICFQRVFGSASRIPLPGHFRTIAARLQASRHPQRQQMGNMTRFSMGF